MLSNVNMNNAKNAFQLWNVLDVARLSSVKAEQPALKGNPEDLRGRQEKKDKIR